MRRAKHHVYYNLHASCWSIQLRGKVIGHAETVEVTGASFKVRRAGRERVLREGRKNVHAFVVGDAAPAGACDGADLEGMTRVHYRPAAGSPAAFWDDHGRIVESADRVVMTADRQVWAEGLAYAAPPPRFRKSDEGHHDGFEASSQRLYGRPRWEVTG